jgi:hypothetical protein
MQHLPSSARRRRSPATRLLHAVRGDRQMIGAHRPTRDAHTAVAPRRTARPDSAEATSEATPDPERRTSEGGDFASEIAPPPLGATAPRR